MDPAIKAKLKEKFGSSVVPSQTGGKGSVRRKKKVVRKTGTQDDSRLQMTLKKLNVNAIPAIEEVNLFKDDSTVIHFKNPKVQASLPAHTYVVSGQAETKPLTDLLPGILTQMGQDNMEGLKKLLSAYEASGALGKTADEDGDDVPDLVENFEAAADEEDGEGEK